MAGVRAAGIVQNTPEWLAFRQGHFGGSDASIVAGERPSLVKLVSEKQGRLEVEEPDAETQLLFKLGHLIEDDLMAIYPDLSGRQGVRSRGIFTSPEWPVAAYSPDGETRKGAERRGISFKLSKSSKWPTALAAGELVPGDVLAQEQHGMYVMGWDAVDVLVLLYGAPKLIELPRDDEYIGNLIDLEREAWAHVEDGTLPEEIDGSEETRHTLSRLHPTDCGPVLPRTLHFVELARELAAARALVKEAGAEEDRLANTLASMLGDAAGVEGVLTYHRGKEFASVNHRQVVESATAAGLDLSPYIEAATTMRSTRPLRVILKES